MVAVVDSADVSRRRAVAQSAARMAPRHSAALPSTQTPRLQPAQTGGVWGGGGGVGPRLFLEGHLFGLWSCERWGEYPLRETGPQGPPSAVPRLRATAKWLPCISACCAIQSRVKQRKERSAKQMLWARNSCQIILRHCGLQPGNCHSLTELEAPKGSL